MGAREQNDSEMERPGCAIMNKYRSRILLLSVTLVTATFFVLSAQRDEQQFSGEVASDSAVVLDKRFASPLVVQKINAILSVLEIESEGEPTLFRSSDESVRGVNRIRLESNNGIEIAFRSSDLRLLSFFDISDEGIPDDLTHADAISAVEAAEAMEEFFSILGTPREVSSKELKFRDLDDGGLIEDDLLGACWVYLERYSRFGIPFIDAATKVEVSAYSGKVVSYLDDPPAGKDESVLSLNASIVSAMISEKDAKAALRTLLESKQVSVDEDKMDCSLGYYNKGSKSEPEYIPAWLCLDKNTNNYFIINANDESEIEFFNG